MKYFTLGINNWKLLNETCAEINLAALINLPALANWLKTQEFGQGPAQLNLQLDWVWRSLNYHSLPHPEKNRYIKGLAQRNFHLSLTTIRRNVENGRRCNIAARR